MHVRPRYYGALDAADEACRQASVDVSAMTALLRELLEAQLEDAEHD